MPINSSLRYCFYKESWNIHSYINSYLVSSYLMNPIHSCKIAYYVTARLILQAKSINKIIATYVTRFEKTWLPCTVIIFKNTDFNYLKYCSRREQILYLHEICHDSIAICNLSIPQLAIE